MRFRDLIFTFPSFLHSLLRSLLTSIFLTLSSLPLFFSPFPPLFLHTHTSLFYTPYLTFPSPFPPPSLVPFTPSFPFLSCTVWVTHHPTHHYIHYLFFNFNFNYKLWYHPSSLTLNYENYELSYVVTLLSSFLSSSFYSLPPAKLLLLSNQHTHVRIFFHTLHVCIFLFGTLHFYFLCIQLCSYRTLFLSHDTTLYYTTPIRF